MQTPVTPASAHKRRSTTCNHMSLIMGSRFPRETREFRLIHVSSCRGARFLFALVSGAGSHIMRLARSVIKMADLNA